MAFDVFHIIPSLHSLLSTLQLKKDVSLLACIEPVSKELVDPGLEIPLVPPRQVPLTSQYSERLLCPTRPQIVLNVY